MPNNGLVVLRFKAWRRDSAWNEIITLSVENLRKLTGLWPND